VLRALTASCMLPARWQLQNRLETNNADTLLCHSETSGAQRCREDPLSEVLPHLEPYPALGTSGWTAMRTTRAPLSEGRSGSWYCWDSVHGIRSPWG
jgi:hypothetical protein